MTFFRVLILLTLFPLLLQAEEYRYFQLSLSNISTTGAPTSVFSTNDSGSRRFFSGKIRRLEVDVSASADVDIDLVAKTQTGKPWIEKKIYGKQNVTADEIHYPFTLASNENGTNVNTYTVIEIVNQMMTLQASNATTTNQSATVTIIYEPITVKPEP